MRDGVTYDETLNDPRKCYFDPASILCKTDIRTALDGAVAGHALKKFVRGTRR